MNVKSIYYKGSGKYSNIFCECVSGQDNIEYCLIKGGEEFLIKFSDLSYGYALHSHMKGQTVKVGKKIIEIK